MRPVPGVYYDRERNRYRVYVGLGNGRRRYLRFETLEEALAARDSTKGAPTSKVCTRCRKDKPLSEFTPAWNGRLGYHARCKACRARDVARVRRGDLTSTEEQTIAKMRALVVRGGRMDSEGALRLLFGRRDRKRGCAA